MKIYRTLAAAAGIFVAAWPANAQNRNPVPALPFELRQDTTAYNYQSVGGVPISSTPGVPSGSNGRAPTPAQQQDDNLTTLPATLREFQSQIVFGAVVAPRNHALNSQVSYAANAAEANLDLPRGTSDNQILVVMTMARVGAPWLGRQVSFQFGAVIPVPLVKADGSAFTAGEMPEDYWFAEPHRPTRLATNDVIGLASLAGKLQNPGNPATTYIASRLTGDTKSKLGNPNEALRTALAADLNAMIVGESIYELKRFSNVVLSLEAQNLDPASSSEASRVRINRLLLEDVFPGELARSAGNYYWSPHARTVYAIQPGPVDVVWKKAAPTSDEPADFKGNPARYSVESGNYYTLYRERYVVSGSAVKVPRKMYWTEDAFRSTGKPVAVPAGRVGVVNVVNNNNFPKRVEKAYRPLGQTPVVQDPNQTLEETRTLWYDKSLRQILAYNLEGRVFVELLGDTEENGRTRRPLGIEIVDVIREPQAADVTTELGERLTAYAPAQAKDDADLYPDPIADAGQNMIFRQFLAGSGRPVLHAIRETRNANDVQVHWLETGLEGLRWPYRFVRYKQVWPDDVAKYSHYLRPLVATEAEAKATAVPMPAENAPLIDYQDPLDQPRAKLTETFAFYTFLSTTYPAHRTLLRFSSGESLRFERIFSWLDAGLKDEKQFADSVAARLKAWDPNQKKFNFPGTFSAPRVVEATAEVGRRINAPTGEPGAVDGADYLAGHIHLPSGDAFNPGAYVDPFVSGFEAANRGAIIPVNAAPGKALLEVWWFRENQIDPTKGFKPIHWPSVLGRYSLKWPYAPSEIVLASNDGSGPLESLEAKGRIYYQNDRRFPGYNPNEEHALMQGGQAFALRDDLNIVTGPDYSSEPYVLLGYVAADDRPAMRVFKVLREKPAAGLTFDYTVEAGSILQPPMPLPLMEKPLAPKVIGAPPRSLNVEVREKVVERGPKRDPNDILAGFTFQDRKGDLWVYRGPHDVEDHPTTAMRFYYKTLPGFFFPSLPYDQQPPTGTITPYLRDIDLTGAFVGDPVYGNRLNPMSGDGNAFLIQYLPVWPASAPVLQMAETLTLPKRGLPAVRGQTSLEVLYQQSRQTRQDLGDSVVLHDPTREKEYALSPTGLKAIPGSVSTQDYRGKAYFPNLPPHLSERLFLDPNRGENGALVFKGEFRDEALGDDYLLLNVLGTSDLAYLKGLCLAGDADKAQWDAAVDGLTTELQSFVENPGKPGTYMPSATAKRVGPAALSSITDDDIAVDSYALTAVGPGVGYVTLIAGNGLAFTPASEPVSVQVIQVADTLYRGEVKIIAGSNPLSETLAMQQVVDLAGKAQDFNFEWKIASPVDGLPPVVYSTTPVLLMGNGPWNHLRFPLLTDHGAKAGSLAASRVVQGPETSVSPISRIPFITATLVGLSPEQFGFEIAGGSGGSLVTGNAVVMRDANGTEVYGVTHGLSTATSVVVEVVPGQAAAESFQRPVELYERTVPGQPQSVVFREFTRPDGWGYAELWLSMDIDPALGATVYVDGQLAAKANQGDQDTPTSTAPGNLSPLSRAYRLDGAILAGGTRSAGNLVKHIVSVELFAAALPDAQLDLNVRLEANQTVDVTDQGWLPLGETRYPDGVRAILGGGADVQSLADNYLIMRYQAKNANHASFKADPGVANKNVAWSAWTRPQLAEGWIKRVLGGINPFNQRVNNLFNNSVNTDVSLIQQAGPRWEGDVALNLDTINNSGLIEIYETVLGRGKKLSIAGGINYGPANDALLLASGYLNDLYMLLGNEAWADAANPTIGIGTKDRTYGDVATALFSFKGQLPTLLEEELALLRGRDDSLLPGVELRPVYNRLVWNYTRGIDAGEVVYALNYNILDLDENGRVDADDARRLYPQGHGDAYGHYLTAVKGYYGLLLDTDFDWVPRIEAVTVLGQPVSVDYQDERKFAAAAGALARAGKQVLDLTWRRDYQPGSDIGWEHLAATRVSTGNRTRYWGVDHWATRTGQGSFLNWVVGNAILPDRDPDPSHEGGIQQIDRTTVLELAELPTLATSLQTALDNAESRLTPLGLPETSVPFDINPSSIVNGANTTHFEQIYERSRGALQNALAAFDDTKDVTRLMRSEEDSLLDFRTSVNQQELAYTNRLIELYGTPYPEDIGPGKTYRTGFSGPDTIHYMYVDAAEVSTSLLASEEETVVNIDTQTFRAGWVDAASGISDFNFITKARVDGIDGPLSENYQKDQTLSVKYTLAPHGFFQKPSTWGGRRSSPGRIQQAISDIIKARNSANMALNDLDGAKGDLDWAIKAFERKKASHKKVRDWQTGALALDQVTKTAKLAYDIGEKYVDQTVETVTGLTDDIVEAIPQSLVAGLAAGGDLTAPARAAVKAAGGVVKEVTGWGKVVAFSLISALEYANESASQLIEFTQIAPEEWDQELRDATTELRIQVSGVQGKLPALNQSLQALDDAKRAYRSLLAEGDRIAEERLIFRQRAAAVTQGYRTRDAAFRIFRNEKLERYKALFDLASQYAFMAAQAFDYETGLLYTPQGKRFISRIVQSRALGVMGGGEPQFAGSNTGDPGLSSALAEMQADWQVLKGRLGFNNPDAYGTTVSVRTENLRLLPGVDGDQNWKDQLSRGRMANLLDDPDVRRFCLQPDAGQGLAAPGIVVQFSTTIADGLNLFGRPLAGGDHAFSPSSFATKIHSVGVSLEGYQGMDNPSANGGAVGFAGGASPGDPSLGFLNPQALSATPYIYLIPVGVDSMRSPPLGDQSVVRTWSVDDVAVPLPFNIGGSGFSSYPFWQSSQSLSEPLFAARKHQAFRPVSSATLFPSDVFGGGVLATSQFTNRRLIGRSVWNSRWKLVIPGRTLLHDPNEGLDRLIQTVKDIKLHFGTYSYAGN